MLTLVVDPAPIPIRAPGVKGSTRVQEPSRSERAIARRTAEARATIPDLELGAAVDMRACLALHAGTACSVTAILVRACALALRGVPRANAAYRDGRFELYSRVNVGVVVATDDGEAIAAVLDADQKPLEVLSDEIERLTGRAGRGELTPPELSGATFTLSDLSGCGVAHASTTISPPHAAAIAAGAIREVPVVRDQAIVPGFVMALTLACDHRILYGAQAARFLSRVQSLLEGAEL